MRCGRLAEANALPVKINSAITTVNSTRFSVREISDSKDMWQAVSDITGKRKSQSVIAGIDATALNNHYASISSDPSYQSTSQSDYLLQDLDWLCCFNSFEGTWICQTYNHRSWWLTLLVSQECCYFLGWIFSFLALAVFLLHVRS